MLAWHSLVQWIERQWKQHLSLPALPCPKASLTAQQSCQRGRRVADENTDTAPLSPVPNDPRFSHRLPLPQQLWPGSIRALFALLSINQTSSEAPSFPDTMYRYPPALPAFLAVHRSELSE